MLAIENYVALFFVLPATLSVFISLLWPGKPAALWAAAALLFLNIYLLLIAWYGLLFLPSLVLLVLGARRVHRTKQRPSS